MCVPWKSGASALGMSIRVKWQIFRHHGRIPRFFCGWCLKWRKTRNQLFPGEIQGLFWCPGNLFFCWFHPKSSLVQSMVHWYRILLGWMLCQEHGWVFRWYTTANKGWLYVTYHLLPETEKPLIEQALEIREFSSSPVIASVINDQWSWFMIISHQWSMVMIHDHQSSMINSHHHHHHHHQHQHVLHHLLNKCIAL